VSLPVVHSAHRPWLNLGNDHGSITAEFALVLPAVILILACCLGGIRVVTLQMQLSDAASIAARIVARGESMGSAAAAASTVVGNAHFDRSDAVSPATGDEIVCVTARAGRSPGLLGLIAITGSSCALKVGSL
jgi:Flp pilus assembly protein TadG